MSHPRERIGERVRFEFPTPACGRVGFEGQVLRWRRDRGGKVGWFDVKCDDGIERSVRPTRAETV